MRAEDQRELRVPDRERAGAVGQEAEGHPVVAAGRGGSSRARTGRRAPRPRTGRRSAARRGSARRGSRRRSAGSSAAAARRRARSRRAPGEAAAERDGAEDRRRRSAPRRRAGRRCWRRSTAERPGNSSGLMPEPRQPPEGARQPVEADRGDRPASRRRRRSGAAAAAPRICAPGGPAMTPQPAVGAARPRTGRCGRQGRRRR